MLYGRIVKNKSTENINSNNKAIANIENNKNDDNKNNEDTNNTSLETSNKEDIGNN